MSTRNPQWVTRASAPKLTRAGPNVQDFCELRQRRTYNKESGYIRLFFAFKASAEILAVSTALAQMTALSC